ncbi:MAG: D-tyrosyl-tRNA(Tyr) deacylase [Thiothrix nivea]|nr:MAG: D-tyrosyl-tRNA(Tyr) deacylase [Thiothrix nivea]
MIGLIQRVSRSSVVIDGQTVAAIGRGITLLFGVEKNDGHAQADRLLQRVLNYRIFSDPQGRMNCSLLDKGYELLIVPQFTLPADTRKGNRPGFSPAAPPELGSKLFDYFCTEAEKQLGQRNCGVFGADMQVHLINDGPVTFWLQQ